MRNDCKIVKDILPNYVEDLVSKETKEYVEEHINNCNECRQALETIQKDINRNSKSQDEQIEMKHFKKCRKRILLLNFFAIALWTIIFIVIAIFARKFYLINKIMKNVGKNSEIKNYRINKIYLGLNEGELFFTNGKVVVYGMTSRDNNSDSNAIYYMNMEDNHLAYVIDTINKTYRIERGVPYQYQHQLTDEIYEEMTFKDKIVALFTWKIDSKKVDGKECYYICKDIDEVAPGDEYEFWISKENYCKVKATTKEDGMAGEPEKTIYYHVETNIVTEYDVSFEHLFPEFSDYKKQVLNDYLESLISDYKKLTLW